MLAVIMPVPNLGPAVNRFPKINRRQKAYERSRTVTRPIVLATHCLLEASQYLNLARVDVFAWPLVTR